MCINLWVYGQQPLAFYNRHYDSTCYLSLMFFDDQSGAMVAAVLRPGKRPFGDENAMIMRCVLKLIRHHFPNTHILVRGDGHFNGLNRQHAEHRLHLRFFLQRQAARDGGANTASAVQTRDVIPNAVRLFDEFTYRARSWQKACRVLLKAEVMLSSPQNRS